ncbi:FliH/SctL family protein [Bosea sp. (in: a-proteobacteria)]|uniref:FliH/SctL family protein n=1 Tax=Bosea sp. (in: a-proteobacteria) TaxID=1871050 RepID=UPI0027328B73|nr:FliH/SctL family protein [Bosea sp. (in: a-proteobacteria)]MDP3407751.1 FliH/SctL family protein [Bosea sp. (in: a-proteobacteria)]
MMSTAQKFTFGTDFREGGRRAAGEADVAAARAEGVAAGREQGRREAEMQLNGLVAQLARAAERLVTQQAVHAAEVEAQAAYVAIVAAKALAGAALNERPAAALESGLRECLGHARLAPHLVMRVNDGAVEAAEGLVKRLVQEMGFAGRVVVLGDPDIAAGDGRIEWADGGFAIESERLAQLVDQAVATMFPGFRPPASEDDR